jgi:uncharacterized protein YndB with AHSA1/START domain
MFRWLLIIVAALVGLVAVVAIAGWMMPREHVASSAVTIQQPPDSVWTVVRDLASVDAWWPEVEKSERVNDQRGREMYRHVQKSGFEMPLLVTESVSPSRLVTEIAPANTPFGGTWTYEVGPADGGTRVTITEQGWIANPIFRFMANVFFGMHGAMDSYLRALGRRFGEDVTPVHQG